MVSYISKFCVIRWWLVAYPNDNGQQERWFETRNQVITRKNSQSKWSTNTSDFKRQSDDGKNKTESILIDDNLSESSDGGKTISTTTEDFVTYLRKQTTIKELAEKTTIKKTTIEHWFRKDKAGFSYPSVENWEEINHI